MATLTLRIPKGSPLTNQEVDDNFSNLNTDIATRLTAGDNVSDLTNDANYIVLTDLSVGAEGTAAGDGSISYNNTTGEFTYTPPDLSTYLTSEADTLDTVSDRGATTDKTLNVGGISTSGSVSSATLTTTGNGTVGGEFIAASYNETLGTITSSDLDLETGNVFEDAINADTIYTFSNPPASGTAYGFTLKVSVTGTRTIDWPTSVDWAGGTAPDAPADGETDVYVFYTTDGGTTYYGFQAGDAMA